MRTTGQNRKSRRSRGAKRKPLPRLANAWGRPCAKQCRAPNLLRLRLEQLEDRRLLNGGPFPAPPEVLDPLGNVSCGALMGDEALARDDRYYVYADNALCRGVVNGTFELGDLTGWTTYTIDGGTLGGPAFPDVVSFDANSDSIATQSARFLVGDGGGGIYQSVVTAAGVVRVTADIAAASPVADPEGGVCELWFDGTMVASHDFGSIDAENTEFAVLEAMLSDVAAGGHEIRLRLTRSGPSEDGVTPYTYVDDVSVFGNTTGVLGNDTDPSSDVLESLFVTPPEHGSLELSSDGSFYYVPEPGFLGEDGFVYRAVSPGQGLTLYTIDRANDELLKLDSATGQLVSVGPIGHDMYTVDLTYQDGILYALNVGGGSYELVSIDPATGAMLAAIPLSGGTITAAKGITSLDGSLYVNYAVKAAYCGNACGAAHILGRLNHDTGAISGLVNYRNLDGGFIHDFHSLATDAEGRIIASREYWETIRKWHLGFDPPSLTLLGGGYPPDASVNDTTTAGSSFYVLNTGGKYLHRYDPENVGYGRALEHVSLGAFGGGLGGLAYAPDFESNAATVSIEVLPAGAPGAESESYEVDEDQTLTVEIENGVLENDSDPESDPLTAELIDDVQNGTLTLLADGSFTYVPNDDYWGTDRFTYGAYDGALYSNLAMATITVNPVNDEPPVAVDDDYDVDEDTVLSVSAADGMLDNDTDFDNDPLTAVLLDGPAHGSLVLNPDCSFEYVPHDEYYGEDRFTYQADDGSVLSGTATVTIQVAAINDAPVNTVPSVQWTAPDAAVVFSSAGDDPIAVNDSDAGTGPMLMTLAATHGTVTLGSTAGLDFSQGDGTEDPAMTFVGTIPEVNAALEGLVFKPTPGHLGLASLEITTDDQGASGGGGPQSDTDTVAVMVGQAASMSFPVPLKAVEPSGGLIYDSLVTASIDSAGDAHAFKLSVDHDQMITAVVDAESTLEPAVVLLDPDDMYLGSASAPAGQDAVVQTAAANEAGTYTVVVGGISDSTGAYTLRLILNAALEAEEHDGPTNDDIASAEDLDGSFITLDEGLAQRGAVLGKGGSDDWYRFTLARGESATLAMTRGGGSLDLYDNGGSRLATAVAEPDASPMISNFVAPTTATYYVKLTAGGEYSLVVTRNADFGREAYHYFEDFESGVGPEWSTTATEGSVKVFSTFLGRLSNQDATLTLPVNVSHRGVLEFDLYLIDTWDGSDSSSGPDYLDVFVDGQRLFHETFANFHSDQTFPRSPDLGRENFGWAVYRDSVYRRIEIPFVVSGPMVLFRFADGGLEGIDNESWGIDNIRVRLADGLLPSAVAQDISPSERVLAHSDGYSDEYQFAVYSGDDLVITTATLSGGAGEFVNNLDPTIKLFDPSGAMVAADDNAAPDDRNARLAHTAVSTGFYTVRVLAADNTTGEYLLDVSEFTPTTPFEVLATDPIDGRRLPLAPAQITVDFKDPVLLTTLAATDLTVDGEVALGVTIVDGNTAIFDLPVLGEGVHDVAIAGGAVLDVQGTPITPYLGQFTVDLTPPSVVASSVLQGGVLPPGTLVYAARFSEELDGAVLGPPDVELVGLVGGPRAPTSFTYDPGDSTVWLKFADLPEDEYTLTLRSGDGRFEDLVGNDLDGEPHPVTTVPSGDGTGGGDFSIDFSADRTSTGANSFERLNPLGGLMFTSSGNTGLLNSVDDQDDFTFSAEAGEMITAAVYPGVPTATLSIAVLGLTGPISAAGPGQPATLPSMVVPEDGTYAIRVTGDMTFQYQLEIGKNLVVEALDTGDGRELPIDGSRLELGSGRYGVLGTSEAWSAASWVWGVQPPTGEIVILDPATGRLLHSLPAPDALAAEHSRIGLTIAEGGQSLLYVNADVDPRALYRLDPLSGEVLSVESIPGASYDGLGFDVLDVQEVIYSAEMNTDPGWTLEGGWQFGVPTGGGSHNQDPTSGRTRNNVIGYNLQGDYPDFLPAQYATMPAIDTSGYRNVTLTFYRWLGVDDSDYDRASIEVSTDGIDWTTIWTNGGSITDDGWVQQTFDLSDLADSQPNVLIRWGMGPTDPWETYPGWNIDDVVVTGTLGSTPYIFLNRREVAIHRQAGFSGSDSSHMAFYAPSGGVGGDDAGRQFTFIPEIGIVEFDPRVPNAPWSGLAVPETDIEGLAFDGVALYASTASGSLYTLDPDTGSVLNMVSVPGGGLFGLGARSATPVGGGRLFAAAMDGSQNIVELDPVDGAELNRFVAPEALTNTTGLAFDGRSLFFMTSTDGPNMLYELDPNTGEVIDSDEVTVGSGNFDGLAVLEGRVYVLDRTASDIIEFDPVTDTVADILDIDGLNSESVSGGLAGIAGPNALLAIGTYQGYTPSIVEIDPATGVIINGFPLTETSDFKAGVAAVGGNIYVGSLSGLRKIEVFDRAGNFVRNIGLSFPVSALGGDRDRNSVWLEVIANGGFETGDFSGWTASSSGSGELTPWTVGTAGGGFFFNSSPAHGMYSAYNGFDGEAGLQYDLYQDVIIPENSAKATLTTNHRIVYMSSGFGTQDRTLQVSVRDTADNLLETLYTERISPGITPETDLGWNRQLFDLSAYAGQTVRIHFSEAIPESYPGPAMIEFDDISLLVEEVCEQVMPDVDEYTLDMTGSTGQPIDILFAGQDGVDFSAGVLELLDADGITVLATASPDPLGVAANYYDLAILGFAASADGTYTLRLTSSVKGKYGIVVTERLTMESEPNARMDDPLRSLAGTGLALGYLEATTSLLFVGEWQSPISAMIHTVDPHTGSILNSFAAPASLTDHAVKLNLAFDGERLFCSMGSDGTTIYVLDARDGTVLGSFEATATAFGIGLGYVGGELFIVDHGQNEIDVYDAESFEYLRSVAAPHMPLAGLSGDDTNRLLYAVSRSTHDLLQIDPATGEVLASVTLSPGDYWGAAVLGGELFVSRSDGYGSPTQQIAVYDATTLGEVRRFTMPISTMIAGLGGDGAPVGFSPDAAGRIGPDSSDWYKLDLTAGDSLALSTQTLFDNIAGSPSNDLNPKLVIMDPNHQVIASDNDSAPDGKNARVSFVAPETGTYLIRVGAEFGYGEYLLKVITTLFWDGLGDGNWGDSGRWVNSHGTPVGRAPDETMHAVVRTNIVTMAEDCSIGGLTVESGAIHLGAGNTLTVEEHVEFAADAEYVCEVNGAANGLIAAAGNVTLGGTLSILPVGVGNVNPSDPSNNTGDHIYTVVDTGPDGRVLGKFATEPPLDDPTTLNLREDHLGLGVFNLEKLTYFEGGGLEIVTSVTAKLRIAKGGDGNGDGYVDVQDINTLVANFGSNPELNTWTDGDTAGRPLGRGDGYVDVQDINILVANFGIYPDPGPTATATATGEDNPAGPVCDPSVPPEMVVSGETVCSPVNLDAPGGLQNAGVDSPFPFRIEEGRFMRHGQPVFLNIICYQPLEPGQDVQDEISLTRVQDDLRRFEEYQGGGDPVVLRVYPRPTGQYPVRMPREFYDGIRELGFWIIRDIYVPEDIHSGDAVDRAKAAVDAVINEVSSTGALDRIFAWEIGNEFLFVTDVGALEAYLREIRDYIRNRLEEPDLAHASKWVTWATYPGKDLLRTDGSRVRVEMDFYSINAYSYDPERIRDHQPGPATGTPFSGYLKALAEAVQREFPGKPLVISETGLPDSPTPTSDVQQDLHPWYPIYRKGGLNSQQVAENLVDRYMDMRLPGLVSGMAVFEWNDEWWKASQPEVQNHPEEYFGLGRFDEVPGDGTYELRYKLQQEAVRDLFTLDFDADYPIVTDLVADDPSLGLGGTTTVRATVNPAVPGPVRFRWESSRGRIVGDADTVQFYAGKVALGPAEVTLLAVDADGNADTASVTVDIDPSNGAEIEILTLGGGRASGRVANVDIDRYKVVVYVETDQQYPQPYDDAPLVFTGPIGYWWTKVHYHPEGELIAWLVPQDFEPIRRPKGSPPPEGTVAEARSNTINDSDGDLLPDDWETTYFGGLGEDRYGDPDDDLAYNLEEFLASTAQQFVGGNDPTVADNDTDDDTLPDNWEYLFFRTLDFGPDDDPDGDELSNQVELGLGIHPGRTAPDRDRDELPDLWEIRFFGDLTPGSGEDPNGDGLTNLDAYELGESPIATWSFFHTEGRDIVADDTDERTTFRGVNLTGLEYGSFFDYPYTGEEGKDYSKPWTKEVYAIADLGLNVVRVPFEWARLVPGWAPGDPLPSGLEPGYLAMLDDMVGKASRQGLYVILDMHDFLKYWSGQSDQECVSDSPDHQDMLAETWKLLAAHYVDNPTVLGYDLMNEPVRYEPPDEICGSSNWHAIVPRIVEAIREEDQKHLIFVEGPDYSLASDWPVLNPEPFVTDPISPSRIVYSPHVYFDYNNDSHYDQPGEEAGPVGQWEYYVRDRLMPAIDWSIEYDVPIFISETGVPCTTEWAGLFNHAFQSFLEPLEITTTAWHYVDTDRWPHLPAPELNLAGCSELLGILADHPGGPYEQRDAFYPTPLDSLIYDDGRVNPWHLDGSWSDVVVDDSVTDPVFDGDHSISVQFNGNWGGLKFLHQFGLESNRFGYLQFWIYPTSSDLDFRIFTTGPLPESVEYPASYEGRPRLVDYVVDGELVAGQWQSVNIPLEDIVAPGKSVITGIAFQDDDQSDSVFYLDDVFIGPAFYWYGEGDGNWNDIDEVGYSHWIDRGDRQITVYPDDERTNAVVRSDTVTVTTDCSVHDLTVESGKVEVNAGSTLTVADSVEIAPIGVVSVDGEFMMEDSSQYVCQVDGAANGLIDVAGNVTLSGTLNVEAIGVNSSEIGTTITRTVIDTVGTGTIAFMFETEPPTSGPASHVGKGVFYRGSTYTAKPPGPDTYSQLDIHLDVARGGDGNGDGRVDTLDITNLVANFGVNPGLNTWLENDTAGGAGRGEGNVDTLDITDLVANFDPPPSPDPGPTAKLGTGEKATTIEKLSAHDAVLEEVASRESQNGRISMATMDWLYDCDQIATTSRPSKKHDPAKEAADMLLATYWE